MKNLFDPHPKTWSIYQYRGYWVIVTMTGLYEYRADVFSKVQAVKKALERIAQVTA
jgi:hypothetical protein